MDIDKISLNSLSNETLGLLKAVLSILVDHADRSGAEDVLIITTSALAREGFSKEEFFQILDLINKIKGSNILVNAEDRDVVVVPGLDLRFNREMRVDTYIEVLLGKGANEVLKPLLLETQLSIDKGLTRNSHTEKHTVISDTPEGTTWANMRLQFTGPHSVHVSVPSGAWARDGMTPKDFGLEKMGGKAMMQWAMLQALSKNDGKFPLTNFSGKGKETKRRQLTELSRILQLVFPNVTGGRALRPMDGDGYECAFELLPEQSDESR